MADPTDSTTSTVIPLPGAGPYAGKTSHKAKLEKRREREILLACLEENQRAVAYSAAQATCHAGRIGELISELWALDGYRALDWGPDPRPVKERDTFDRA